MNSQPESENRDKFNFTLLPTVVERARERAKRDNESLSRRIERLLILDAAADGTPDALRPRERAAQLLEQAVAVLRNAQGESPEALKGDLAAAMDQVAQRAIEAGEKKTTSASPSPRPAS